jgi:hypothetical protein
MALSPSMIIGDLDLMGSVSHPDETDPPLIVDPYAVLPGAISFEFLQAVSPGCQQVFEIGGTVEHSQLPLSHFSDAGELFYILSGEQQLRLLVPKPSDHDAQRIMFYALRKAKVL